MSETVLNQDLSEKAPNRPQMLIAQLLFSEKPERCSAEKARAAMAKYCGDIGETCEKSDILLFPINGLRVEFADKPEGVPPLACFMQPAEFSMKPDEMTRSQFWDMENGADFIENAKYEVIVYAMLSAGLSYREQAELFVAQLDAACEMYPSCGAIFTAGSGKLVPIARFLEDRQWDKAARFLKTAVNVRFFTIEDTDEMLVDSLGMYLLGLPEVQLHFRALDANFVVNYAYNLLDYQYENDFPIESGDVLDGIGADGNISENVHWRAQYENSLIQPIRPVLDINCGENAAGSRE